MPLIPRDKAAGRTARLPGAAVAGPSARGTRCDAGLNVAIRNTRDRFGAVTRLLHWVIALLIIALICLGKYMVGLTYFDRWYNSSLSWHKALGMIVLGLGLAKIGWQLYSPLPAHPASLKPWERIGATLMHRLLLTMMVLIPATGYLVSTSEGSGIAVFNWFVVPALFPVSTKLRDLAIAVHFYLAYGTALVLIGHIGAALKHQFMDRDGTLVKMLWK
jgi:cytochrome b561